MKLLIGENIKRLRKAKDITQEQLATAMNVTCAAVSKWERDETYPDITLLIPLAFYFGVSIDELMDYDETKVQKEIDGIISEYKKLYRYDRKRAQQLIISAYEKYPNDYVIMSNYMWNLGGDYADNDRMTLLKYKDEFTSICKKILDGCTNNEIKLNAYNMLGKLLWAEGNVEQALEFYQNNFVDWYTTVGQKSEQLFSKDTPEFLYWLRKNMYELISFAGDKLTKSIFYDNTIPTDEKFIKIELFGDNIRNIYEETKEIVFLVFAKSIMERLERLVTYKGGTLDDQNRIKEKCKKLCDDYNFIRKTDKSLNDIK